jgi:tRNA (mo5U34)-methyltransferase
MSIYDFEYFGPEFDVVFCFGVLYHLKHPLLALENIARYCSKGAELYIETAILDGMYHSPPPFPFFQFFPGSEYGGNPSNWWVGNLDAWCDLVSASGFTVNESWKLTESPNHLSDCRGFIKATLA